jgi:UDP-N-acetylmuramyl pentapeptide synthase
LSSLTLLSFNSETEIGIVGANHKKEIEFLSIPAQPDYGYITNFGKAHLEGLGCFRCYRGKKRVVSLSLPITIN